MNSLTHKFMKTLLLLTVPLLLSVGCASTRQFVPRPTEATLSNYGVLVQAKRKSPDIGAACGLEVKDNGKKVGVLGVGGQIEWVRLPGPMKIDVRDTLNNISFRPLEIVVAAGHRYELSLAYPWTFTWPGGSSDKQAATLSKAERLADGQQVQPSVLQTAAIAPTTPATITGLTPSIEGKLTESEYGTCHALIISNSAYSELPELRTPTNDGRALSKLLHIYYGFHVTTLYNATRAEIIRTLTSLRTQLTEKDNLLIFYAGHGWLDTEADAGYWLPVDASKHDPVNWISNATVTFALKALRAKHVLVVADSCYSGKLTRGLRVDGFVREGFSRLAHRRARVVISSGGLEPVLDGGAEGNHSVFVNALLKVLNENQNVIDATGLFSELRKRVVWNADQIPEYGVIHKAGHDGGDFLFIRKYSKVDPNVPNKTNAGDGK